jgi:hypothetical protein
MAANNTGSLCVFMHVHECVYSDNQSHKGGSKAISQNVMYAKYISLCNMTAVKWFSIDWCNTFKSDLEIHQSECEAQPFLLKTQVFGTIFIICL